MLFLGNSESLGSSSNFTLMNPSQRLYTRKGVGRSRARPSLTMPIQRVTPQQRPIARVAFGQEVVPEQHINLLKALIRTLAQHPCLLLDENHDLVEVIGDVSPNCRIPEGSMTAASGGSLLLPGLASSLKLEVVPLQAGGRSFTVLSFIPERTATAPTPAQQLPADLVQLARRVVSSSHPTTGQMAVLSLGDSPGRSVQLSPSGAPSPHSPRG